MGKQGKINHRGKHYLKTYLKGPAESSENTSEAQRPRSSKWQKGKLPTYPMVCTMISLATSVIPRNPELCYLYGNI